MKTIFKHIWIKILDFSFSKNLSLNVWMMVISYHCFTEIMAWHQLGDIPLPEAVMTKINSVSMAHQTRMRLMLFVSMLWKILYHDFSRCYTHMSSPLYEWFKPGGMSMQNLYNVPLLFQVLTCVKYNTKLTTWTWRLTQREYVSSWRYAVTSCFWSLMQLSDIPWETHS